MQLAENCPIRMEQLLAPGDRAGAPSLEQTPLLTDDRESLLERVRGLRSEIEVVTKDLRLERRTVDVHQALSTELTSVWLILENCRPARLREGNGLLGTPAGTALEEGVQKMLAKVIGLRSELRRQAFLTQRDSGEVPGPSKR
jgi:hypothetical protein